jgi:hypothetical protein
VQASLDRLIASGGATVVLVAHRLSTVMGADKIAVIDGGRVLEEGNHAFLVQQGGVYANLVKKQTAKMALVEAGGTGAAFANHPRGSSSSGSAGSGGGGGEVQTIDQLLDEVRASEAKAASAPPTDDATATEPSAGASAGASALQPVAPLPSAPLLSAPQPSAPQPPSTQSPAPLPSATQPPAGFLEHVGGASPCSSEPRVLAAAVPVAASAERAAGASEPNPLVAGDDEAAAAAGEEPNASEAASPVVSPATPSPSAVGGVQNFFEKSGGDGT